MLPTSTDQCDIDQAWNSLSLYFQSMLYYAKRRSMHQLGKSFTSRGSKNSLLTSNHMPRFGKLDSATDTFHVRKLRNHAAKLQEAYKLILASKSNTADYLNLMRSISSSSFYDSSIPIYQNLDVTLSNLDDGRKRDK